MKSDPSAPHNIQFLLKNIRMTAITKSKLLPAVEFFFCGWVKSPIYVNISFYTQVLPSLLKRLMARFVLFFPCKSSVRSEKGSSYSVLKGSYK